MMNVSFDNLYKILVLGDAAVGKTNFLIRFTENTFAENYINTIGFDYRSEIINIDEKKIKLQIWDTAGQDRYRSMTKNLYHKAQGVVLMFDVTSESSFINIKSWLKSIKDMSGDKMSIILVGNKIDDEKNRKITQIEARNLAEENDLKYLETSGKTNINVKETFYTLAKEIMNRKGAFDKVEGKRLHIREDRDESRCLC
jgi:Ras-related protein Rab-1A